MACFLYTYHTQCLILILIWIYEEASWGHKGFYPSIEPPLSLF